MTSSRAAGTSEEVETLLATSKIVTALVAHTLTGIGSSVTTPQMRVLVMLESKGPLNLTAVAAGLDVNASNASRTCEQLVGEGLVVRRQNPDDRRAISLRLSRKGANFVARIMDERRKLFGELVDRMGSEERRALVLGLNGLIRATDSAAHETVETDGHHHPFRWLL